MKDLNNIRKQAAKVPTEFTVSIDEIGWGDRMIGISEHGIGQDHTDPATYEKKSACWKLYISLDDIYLILNRLYSSLRKIL
jgi:hypothetical protein